MVQATIISEKEFGIFLISIYTKTVDSVFGAR